MNERFYLTESDTEVNVREHKVSIIRDNVAIDVQLWKGEVLKDVIDIFIHPRPGNGKILQHIVINTATGAVEVHKCL